MHPGCDLDGSQISGGHKYLPPKQDVNAPDLYIPTMSVGTYCLLLCLAAATRAKFKPEVMTAAVRFPCLHHCPITLLGFLILFTRLCKNRHTVCMKHIQGVVIH